MVWAPDRGPGSPLRFEDLRFATRVSNFVEKGEGVPI